MTADAVRASSVAVIFSVALATCVKLISGYRQSFAYQLGILILLGGYSIVCFICTILLWLKRKEFYVRARVPSLAVLSSLLSILFLVYVGLSEYSLGGADFMPCHVGLWFSLIVLPAINVISHIRALRLLVSFNNEIRKRYCRLLSEQFLRRVLILICSLTTAAALVLYFFVDSFWPGKVLSRCMVYSDAYLIYILFGFHLFVTMLVFPKLRYVRDAFKFKSEMQLFYVHWAFFGAAFVGLHIAALIDPSFALDLDEHFGSYILLAIPIVFGLYAGTIKPLGQYEADSPAIEDLERVMVHNARFHRDSSSNFKSVMWASEEERTPISDALFVGKWSLVAILKDEESQTLFRQFAQMCLCHETVDFWCAVEKYKRIDPNQSSAVVRPLTSLLQTGLFEIKERSFSLDSEIVTPVQAVPVSLPKRLSSDKKTARKNQVVPLVLPLPIEESPTNIVQEPSLPPADIVIPMIPMIPTIHLPVADTVAEPHSTSTVSVSVSSKTDSTVPADSVTSSTVVGSSEPTAASISVDMFWRNKFHEGLQIYNNFLKRGAPFEVNVGTTCTVKCKPVFEGSVGVAIYMEMSEEDRFNIFDTANGEVYRLMLNNLYNPFLESDVWFQFYLERQRINNLKASGKRTPRANSIPEHARWT